MDDYLTPGEIADLKIIAARARMDRGDMAPMRAHTDDGLVVIPWLVALNLDVAA